ncbi:hypothetical protein [Poseidonocella sedimentorum]|uniref:Uncharacterized protein n=1 Tax=Poseidonocella sedimentorum TaxID=871652 RepID=A0A1I6E387_9RHOB|nr:hypothetical protein [Poseidonocella sedimentorum]SFR12205.1 hypothetical protein SAMN04515673_10729 [Poseidonocella sedimentorum]
MQKLTDILAGRALSPAEEAILPDQAKRTMEGIMDHPLLRSDARLPALVAIDPREGQV